MSDLGELLQQVLGGMNLPETLTEEEIAEITKKVSESLHPPQRPSVPPPFHGGGVEDSSNNNMHVSPSNNFRRNNQQQFRSSHQPPQHHSSNNETSDGSSFQPRSYPRQSFENPTSPPAAHNAPHLYSSKIGAILTPQRRTAGTSNGKRGGGYKTDVVRRGNEMRKTWSQDRFLEQKGRQSLRWEIRCQMLQQ
eukprot:PhF_6_TR26960/c0_g1_i1/m.39316